MLIGYARVSTGKQNPDSQRDALEAEGCDRVYLDVVSGAAETLPQREAALDYLRGEEDTLVVRRLPRLGRSLKDLLEVVDAIEEKGANFRSLVEGLRTDTAHGRMTFQIFGALAEFERELIRERTQAGLEAARRRGRTGGRPRAMTEEDVEVACSLMKSGDVPVKQICETVGVSPGLTHEISTVWVTVTERERRGEVGGGFAPALAPCLALCRLSLTTSLPSTTRGAHRRRATGLPTFCSSLSVPSSLVRRATKTLPSTGASSITG